MGYALILLGGIVFCVGLVLVIMSRVSATKAIMQPPQTTELLTEQVDSTLPIQAPSEATEEEQEEQCAESSQTPDSIPPTPPVLVSSANVSTSSTPARVILGISQESGRTIPLSQVARRQGTYIIGVNGTGKSTLIANLIVQDIEQGLGCLR